MASEANPPRDPPLGLPLLAGDPLEALLWGPLRASFGLTTEQWQRLTEVVTLHMALDRLLFACVTLGLTVLAGERANVPRITRRVTKMRFAARLDLAQDAGWISEELALLSAVIERCKTWGLTTADNPVTKVKRFKEPKGRDRVLSYEEEDRLLAALPDPHRTLVQLALETGIRLQREGIPLTWADVDLAKGLLHIKASDAKSGRERWIPLSAGMVARLRAMQAASTNPLIFPAPRGGLLRRFRTTYFETVRELGLAGTRLGIHTLRHTWATRFYEATGDLLLLQRLGGWASLVMVQRYAHARQERAAAAIEQMVAARGDAQAHAPALTPTRAAPPGPILVIP